MASPSSPTLQRLASLDKSSHDFPNQLDDILHGQEYKQCLLDLKLEESVWLVNYLYNLLGDPDSSNDTSGCVSALREICGARRVLPTSLTVSPSDLSSVKSSRQELESLNLGPDGGVYQGILGGSKARVRRVWVSDRVLLPAAQKIVCEEGITWKRLRHPNLVPFLGFIIGPLSFVTEWMPNGELPEYIEKHPYANRVQFLVDVAQGLSYLHSHDIIHKEIMATNILVDGAGRARIADFGLGAIPANIDVMIYPYDYGYITRWQAREIFEEKAFTKKTDVFSFGMVMFEVFAGTIPFSDLQVTTYDPMSAITAGKRPPRPEHPGCTEPLWDLMQRCWDENPDSRPEASAVLEILLANSSSNYWWWSMGSWLAHSVWTVSKAITGF